MSDAIKRVVGDNFSKTVDLAFNTVQLLQYKTLNFLSPELWSRNSSELKITPLTGRFR